MNTPTVLDAGVLSIALPLPLGAVSELMSLIGARWPASVIDTASGSNDRLVMVLKEPATRQRTRLTAALKLAGTAAQREGEVDGPPDAMLTSISPNAMSITPPTDVALALVSAFRDILDDNDSAPNYVEMSVKDADGALYAVVICRPGRPSPHALRQIAEARADRYAAALIAAGIDPATL